MGGHVEICQELHTPGEAMNDKNVTVYVFSVRIVNCPSRNVSLEVLEIFGRIGRDHVKDLQSEFTGPFVKLGQFIKDIPNILPGLQTNIETFK